MKVRPIHHLRLATAAAVLIGAAAAGPAILPCPARAAAAMPAGEARAAAAVEFTRETLPNGLEVVYAPLHQAPVVHVRVLYHVGSRDERPDRQGFAHMFEHMMFRGSEHVRPEEHMKLVGMVGGNSNAFTSFDQTVYVNTLPSSQAALALYLEADRMAGFRVSDQIYVTERKVVTEEWRMKQNRPYGNLFEDFLRAAFTKSPYRWSPIGDMNHLRAAQAAELQEFFNRYYVPNNAVLVIAGDIDPPAAGALARKFFAWIPRGADAKRDIPAEPAQAEPRRAEVRYPVPLARIMIGYQAVPYRSDDNYALALLGTMLGGGRSSRLGRTLVYGPQPTCVDVGARNWTLEDAGIFLVSATVLAGASADGVEQALLAAVQDVRENGVAAEELAKAKVQASLGLVRERETAASIAGALGEAALLCGDPSRVNQELARLSAVTPADVKAAAAKYLLHARSTTLRVVPDPRAAAPEERLDEAVANARPIVPRDIAFPEGYPARPPVAETAPAPKFQKGTEAAVAGVRVIVMPDPRLPVVNWGLTMRRGSDSDPPEKAGLADMTASLLRRGAGGLTFAQLNDDLESRGINIEVAAGDDTTRLFGSCLTEQLDHAMKMSRMILREPAFPADEFARRQAQVLSQLRLQQDSPAAVAQDDLAEALFGAAPAGVHATPETAARITLEDVRALYRAAYRPNDAVLVISGDLTVRRGQELAAALLADWPAAPQPAADYALPAPPQERLIIVVDRPEGRQSTIRMGIRSYDVHSDDKFAGDLAGRILSSGIDSRLGRAVRAEKGLAYSVWGTFRPGRHAGAFVAGCDTTIPSTAEAVASMFHVFDGLRQAAAADQELAEAKLRVAGSMVMGMQTVAQQAAYRVEGILNGYPPDYYDKYPERISRVTAEELRQVADRHLRPDRMVVVVVAPAAQVTEQLARLGRVRVVPMPAGRRDPQAPPQKPPAARKAAA